MVIPTSDLSRPFRASRGHNKAPQLPALLLERDDGLLMSQLALIIEGMLLLDDLSFDRAARTLGLSGRTLQLRLARVGESFSGLVERTRRQLAERWLAQGLAPITDVAMLLGYSDAANFTRAFRRWTGLSPSRYRHEVQGAAASQYWR